MFDTFKVKKPQRSTFSLSHKHETTVNVGDINMLHWNWCFPGDRFKIRYSYLAKFSPMIAPNFSRMRIKSEVFYVPLSDIFDNFHEVIMNYKEESTTRTENGVTITEANNKFPSVALNKLACWFMLNRDNSSGDHDWRLQMHSSVQEYAVARLLHQVGVPFDITYSSINVGGSTVSNPYCSLTKYLDDNTGTGASFNDAGAVPVSLLPFQAYQYVYNWYYRDSVRSPEVDIYPNIFSLAASSPLLGFLSSSTPTFAALSIAESQEYRYKINHFFNSVFQIRRRFYRKDYFNTAVSDPTVGVDSLAVPDNIVDLRKVNQLQKYIEKRALAGNRVAEFIMAHWAFKADNYELGRPILISSSSQNVQISEVLQTSQTTEGESGSAQGTRSGNGNSYGSGNGSFFVAPDYGVLLINMTVVPEISYFSGMPRKLAINRWEHFAWPEFAQIGMQPIYDFELSFPDTPTRSTTQKLTLEELPVFGYAPRYSEFKMELNQVSGEMATSLRFWHQSPEFNSKVNLNNNFGIIGFFDYNEVNSFDEFNTNSYYNQIFAVTDDLVMDHVQVVANFDITVNRALPLNDMPAL